MRKILLLLLTSLSFSAAAQTNYALTLNGTNQDISIGSPIPSAGSYTKEAWVYSTTNTGPRNIISSTNTPFWINGGILSAGQAGSYSLVTDGTSFPLNRWVHVAVTYNAGTSTMRLYRDGMLVSTATSVPAYTAEAAYIGSHNGAASYLQGQVDEVRIWTTALSLADLKKNIFRGPAAGAANLVSHYKFNDGSGTTLTNSASGSNGTLRNGPTWVASPVQFATNALHFDGTDDHVIIPHSVSSDFTVEFLMNTTATGGGGQWYSGLGLVDAEVGGVTNDWGTALSGSKFAFGVGAPDVTIYSTSNVNTGSWVHVAATWRQSTGEMKLYVNGVQEATATGGTNLRNAPTRITMGQIQTNINRYNGTLDEVRIWNAVRTQTEIQANMAKQVDPATQPTLSAYYTFDEGITAGTNSGLTMLHDFKNANNGTLTNFSLSTGTVSNYVAQYSSLTTLPLEWLSFSVIEQSYKAVLNWSTANEQNTASFFVEHSTNGLNWNVITNLAAAGSNQSVNVYSYTHNNPATGLNYYRIKQTDADGQYKFSKTNVLTIAEPAVALIVLSNPVVNGMLQVKMNKPGSLQLYNGNGKLVWQKQTAAGNISANISNMPKGIYWLKTDSQTEKIVLQ